MPPTSATLTASRPVLTLEDRRAHRRLPLNLFLEVCIPAEPAQVIEKGVTTDVSSGGVRFPSFNWRQLAPGTACRVMLSLPFESVMFTNRRRLGATATVVRWIDEEPVARHGPPPVRRGIALRFDKPLTFAASA